MSVLDTVTNILDDDIELTTPVYLPENAIDPRLQLLSHSSRTTLHKCPRKYQLYRLGSEEISLEAEADKNQGVTFAFGTAVGMGVASALESATLGAEAQEAKALIDTFLGWDTELLDENPKQKKSVWEALFAVQKFLSICENGFLDDYELVIYNSLPAVELSFQITLPDGFKYRGFVDAVLRHKITGEVLVLECKTSSASPNSATFKNSVQAIGYSIVLDILFPELSSYSVLYLIYATRSKEYIQMHFEKSLLQRALWLQELLIDTEHVKLYESYGTYPMHGESCFDFFRECEYLSLCTLSTDRLGKPLTQEVLDKIEIDSARYQFKVDFYDLVEAQIEKGTG